MKIGCVIIGNELLRGQIIEENSRWLGKYSRIIGHELIEVRIIEDSLSSIEHAINDMAQNTQVLIISGGLGPTKDDLTKEAIRELLKDQLIENKEAIELVKHQYKKIEKEWSPKTNAYHLIPSKCKPFANEKGLAPGLTFSLNDTEVLCAPGVPIEFKHMVENFLTDQVKPESTRTHMLTIRTKGIFEEKLFDESTSNLWSELERHFKIASLPTITGVNITLLSKNDPPEKMKEIALSLPAVKEIKKYIWHLGEESQEEVILNAIRERNLKLYVAESCTGGLISNKITNVPGSSDVFFGGVVSYANQVKIQTLGVKEEILKKHGAVSQEVAAQMASGLVSKTTNAVSVSTTGIAGPSGGSEDKPVGMVCIGVAIKTDSLKVKTKTFYFKGDREKLKQKFTSTALHMLLDEIQLLR